MLFRSDDGIALAAAAASDCDAIILCRGGGSIEDLWAFNEECVARAIVASRLPVISGVGHETDFTIADFAADHRAATPTAAAEMAAPERQQLLAHLARQQQRLQQLTRRRLADRQQTLDWLRSRLLHPAERIRRQRQAVGELARRLHQAGQWQGTRRQMKLNALAASLKQLDPHAVLARGYALVTGPDGRALRDKIGRAHV